MALQPDGSVAGSVGETRVGACPGTALRGQHHLDVALLWLVSNGARAILIKRRGKLFA